MRRHISKQFHNLALVLAATIVGWAGLAIAQESRSFCPCLQPSDSPYSSQDQNTALRQCRGTYFNEQYSAWFVVDCLVPADQARPGSLVTGRIPGVGEVQLRVLEVFQQPRLRPPEESPQPQLLAVDPHPTRILFQLPAGARLRINGKAVRVDSAQQEVVLCNLPFGAKFKYDFVASYDRDGKEVRDERTILFKTGEEVTVDFRTPK
jgi:uncharacterized protein (TIGR03000 family)